MIEKTMMEIVDIKAVAEHMENSDYDLSKENIHYNYAMCEALFDLYGFDSRINFFLKQKKKGESG